MSHFFLDECEDVKTFAEKRSKHVKTIYEWIHRGLPVFDAFGKTLIHVPSADRWCREHLRTKNQRGCAA